MNKKIECLAWVLTWVLAWNGYAGEIKEGPTFYLSFNMDCTALAGSEFKKLYIIKKCGASDLAPNKVTLEYGEGIDKEGIILPGDMTLVYAPAGDCASPVKGSISLWVKLTGRLLWIKCRNRKDRKIR